MIESITTTEAAENMTCELSNLDILIECIGTVAIDESVSPNTITQAIFATQTYVQGLHDKMDRLTDRISRDATNHLNYQQKVGIAVTELFKKVTEDDNEGDD